jgi:hypothetical protein
MALLDLQDMEADQGHGGGGGGGGASSLSLTLCASLVSVLLCL